MLRKRFSLIGLFALVLASGLVFALPHTNAVTTVIVSMPQGAGNPSGAPGYSPDRITVVIGVNNTVTWTDDDTSALYHTVTSSLVPSGASSFNSGNIGEGGNYTYTFKLAGTYDYFCIYHSWMTGTVIVLAATSSTTTTAEFPTASLALVLLAVIAVVVVASPRLGPWLAKAKG